MSNGGGPYNVLKDIAVLAPEVSREACGLIGNDLNGDWIIEDSRKNGIEVERLPDFASTSYTDAMTVESTGRRTFFHQRGANALLDLEHFSFEGVMKIFHLGYLMLLDRLDEIDDEGEPVPRRSSRKPGKPDDSFGGLRQRNRRSLSGGGEVGNAIGSCFIH